MNKFEKMIFPGENIIHSGRLHYVILIKGFLLFTALLGLSLYIPNILWNAGYPDFILGYKYLVALLQKEDFAWSLGNDWLEYGVIVLSLLSIVMAFIAFLYYTKVYFSSYIVISDNRLIYKTGLFFVYIMEIEIDEIEEIHLHSGVFGALLDYGYIHVDMRFVGEALLPCVPKPYLFMRALHKAHDASDDNLGKIL